MKTVKFAPYNNSEAFSSHVGGISESRFLTLVGGISESRFLTIFCYHPAKPKILSILIQTINPKLPLDISPEFLLK